MSEIATFKIINNHNLFTTVDEGNTSQIVIFCHGFRGTSIGPNRFFVRLARKLQKKGIGTFRFDQYGSGNSEGDFLDSSFLDWIETTKKIAQEYLDKEYKVSLVGQSMGGSTVLAVASELNNKLSSVVAWAADPNIDRLNIQGPYAEESGQIVSWDYWKEAHDINIPEKFKNISIPTYIVIPENDEFVSNENQQALIKIANPNHSIEILKEQKHSQWDYNTSEEVINNTTKFIVNNFQ